MHVWKFDENRCDFVPATATAQQADPDGTYFVSRDGELHLYEGAQVRRISHAETLISVAGQLFERDRFEFQPLAREGRGALLTPMETAALQAEMRRDGALMQQWMRERQAVSAVATWVRDRVLPIADGPWEQIEGLWGSGSKYLSAALYLLPEFLLPSLRVDFGELDHQGAARVVGTLTAQWKGDRVIDPAVTLHGERIELGAWWHEVATWFQLPQVSADAALLEEP